jgi:hypothetical protein
MLILTAQKNYDQKIEEDKLMNDTIVYQLKSTRLSSKIFRVDQLNNLIIRLFIFINKKDVFA